MLSAHVTRIHKSFSDPVIPSLISCFQPKHAAAILMHIPSLIYYQITAGAGAGGSTNPSSSSSTHLRMQLDMTVLLTMMQQELLQPGVVKLMDGDKIVQVLVCLSRLHPTPQHRLIPAEVQARTNRSPHGLRAKSWSQGFEDRAGGSSAAASTPRIPRHHSSTTSSSRQGYLLAQDHQQTGSTLLTQAARLRRTDADIALSKQAATSPLLAGTTLVISKACAPSLPLAAHILGMASVSTPDQWPALVLSMML